MNIYFACSITAGREFEAVYQSIVRALTEAGHEVPTAHLADAAAPESEADILPREVYARDAAWIRNCDVLVAEVSVPSHGVGYEIGFALGLRKRVLALHRQDRKVSKMISGNPDDNLTVSSYQSLEEAIAQVENFLQKGKV